MILFPRDRYGQFRETCLIGTLWGREVLLATCGEREGMLLNILQCTGQPLMSIVPRLRKCRLEGPEAQGHSYREESRWVCPARAGISEDKSSMAEKGGEILCTVFTFDGEVNMNKMGKGWDTFLYVH